MGSLVPSLSPFAKASIGMPGTLFRGRHRQRSSFVLFSVYNEVMACITLLSELMQSLESNCWQKKTQRRLENAFILHISLRLKVLW